MESFVLLTAVDVNIERCYRQLLEKVSLTVRSGELWQLIGANGTGKTSFIRALAGLATLGVTGTIESSETPLYQGHLPGLKLLLTPEENLRWHPSGVITTSLNEIHSALEAVGLAGYEKTLMHNLSAGQQRRVGLARLWLSKARLWLLDEPFTAIDIDGATILERRILEHCDSGGAVVFTSHQPNRMLERLQVLNLGQYAI